MAHTKDGVVIDSATGVVRLVIVPTHDEELLDPAFQPPGHTLLAVPHDPAVDPVATAARLYPALAVKMPPAATLSQGPLADPPLPDNSVPLL
jgi:hypothetical protein